MPNPTAKLPVYNFPVIDVFDDSISDNAIAHHVLAVLTPREVDIFALLIRGRQTKLIAVDLGLAKRTVDFHRYHIKRKLRLKCIAQEAILGYRIRHTLTAWLNTREFQRRCADAQRHEANEAKTIDTSIIP